MVKSLILNEALEQVCTVYRNLFRKFARHHKVKPAFCLRLRNSKRRFTARPFQEYSFLEADANYQDYGADKNDDIVDLDFSNFDIDDNCYVFDTVNGKRSIVDQFKIELKQ